MTRKLIIADSMLLATAFIWGAAFVVVKDTVDMIPPALLVTLRYAIAAVFTSLVFQRHLHGLSRADFLRGVLIGLLLGMAYCVQTIAIKYTTAGKNAFLTTLYVLLVPLGTALLFHEPLRRWTVFCSLLMLVGIGLISLDGTSGGLNRGDLLTILCSFFFAGHMIAVERLQEKTDVLALIVLQNAVSSLVGLAFHLALERGATVRMNGRSLAGLLFLAIFSTTIAMSLQDVAQGMTKSSHAVILLSLESFFGAAFGVLLLGERVTPLIAAGFALIFCSVLLNELSAKENG